MKNSTDFSLILNYLKYRFYIDQHIKGIKCYPSENKIEAVKYLNLLNNLSVTKLSKFHHYVWDWNEDVPEVARNCRGSPLRIDISKYSYIPDKVIIEIKCLMYLVDLSPLSFNKIKSRQKNKRLKVVTIIKQFKAGLNYVNCVFQYLKNTYGDEYVQNKVTTLEKIDVCYYREASKIYDYTYGKSLKEFFGYLYDPYVIDNLFSGKCFSFNPDEFEWRKYPGSKKKKQILPDFIFRGFK